VRTLATLSQMAVLRDLLPAYRIRLPTAQEKATKVSKEIRALRDYEALLLGHYQAFLKHCDASCQTGSGRYAAPHERAYGGTAATCLGELLCAHPHFNFRAHVLKILAAKAGCAAKEMRGPCCTSLENLFDADQQVWKVGGKRIGLQFVQVRLKSFFIPLNLKSFFLSIPS